jgi:hypothetical protein
MLANRTALGHPIPSLLLQDHVPYLLAIIPPNALSPINSCKNSRAAAAQVGSIVCLLVSCCSLWVMCMSARPQPVSAAQTWTTKTHGALFHDDGRRSATVVVVAVRSLGQPNKSQFISKAVVDFWVAPLGPRTCPLSCRDSRKAPRSPVSANLYFHFQPQCMTMLYVPVTADAEIAAELRDQPDRHYATR